VSQKIQSKLFLAYFVKFPRTLTIFGIKVDKTRLSCTVHLLATSANLCQRTTVWNTDAANCYVTRRLFASDGLPLHHQFDRGCDVV